MPLEKEDALTPEEFQALRTAASGKEEGPFYYYNPTSKVYKEFTTQAEALEEYVAKK